MTPGAKPEGNKGKEVVTVVYQEKGRQLVRDRDGIRIVEADGETITVDEAMRRQAEKNDSYSSESKS